MCEDILGSSEPGQIGNTGHELEERHVVELPGDGDLDQIDGIAEHEGFVARGHVARAAPVRTEVVARHTAVVGEAVLDE